MIFYFHPGVLNMVPWVTQLPGHTTNDQILQISQRKSVVLIFFIWVTLLTPLNLGNLYMRKVEAAFTVLSIASRTKIVLQLFPAAGWFSSLLQTNCRSLRCHQMSLTSHYAANGKHVYRCVVMPNRWSDNQARQDSDQY